MVHILYGNSEHGVHVWGSKIGLPWHSKPLDAFFCGIYVLHVLQLGAYLTLSTRVLDPEPGIFGRIRIKYFNGDDPISDYNSLDFFFRVGSIDKKSHNSSIVGSKILKKRTKMCSDFLSTSRVKSAFSSCGSDLGFFWWDRSEFGRSENGSETQPYTLFLTCLFAFRQITIVLQIKREVPNLLY